MAEQHQLSFAQQNNSKTNASQPWVVGTLATYLAMFAWFVVIILVISNYTTIDKPAGIIFYIVLSLISSLVVVPIHMFLLAPSVARWSACSNIKSICLHLIALSLAAVGVWYFPSVANRFQLPPWLIFPYYLVIFMLPAILVGSLVYSIQFNTLNARSPHDTC